MRETIDSPQEMHCVQCGWRGPEAEMIEACSKCWSEHTLAEEGFCEACKIDDAAEPVICPNCRATAACEEVL